MTATPTVYLWEFAPSPHLGNLLNGLASRGTRTRYVVYHELYMSRKSEGWVLPEFPGVEILHARSRKEVRHVIAQCESHDIHICVGLRGNSYIHDVISSLRKAGRPFWVFMETVNERHWWSYLKRPLYRGLLARNRRWLEGVLAAGATTKAWVVARGMPKARVFEFAYFLNSSKPESLSGNTSEAFFRLLYVGNLVPLKRVHLIIEALRHLPEHVVLDVVGDGPLREQLQALAAAAAPGRVIFHGRRPMPEIPSFMGNADCLVLPSDHDGWGAVISEALLAGTRVVCSDRCGAQVVVRASGAGQVFETFTEGACAAALRSELDRGPADGAHRNQISAWAQCLTASSGAAYLEDIIAHVRNGCPRPVPPWHNTHPRPGNSS